MKYSFKPYKESLTNTFAMNKIKLIIVREYTTRVQKKSFIILSLLAPLLFALLVTVPILIAMYASESQEQHSFLVTEATGCSPDYFKENASAKFVFGDNQLEAHKKRLGKDLYGILHRTDSLGFMLISNQQIPLSYSQDIKGRLENMLRDRKMADLKIDSEWLKQLEVYVSLKTVFLNSLGKTEESSSELATGVGFGMAFLIYLFIFVYGTQVMRGVMEEKTNRIVEVVISSVKPFQLMMGKIIGVALVALTQLCIWILLSFAVLTALAVVFTSSTDISQLGTAAPALKDLFGGFQSLPVGWLIGSFIFYFLGGYLLYSSLFAAVGAAVDNETDTQQFILPVSIPLIIAFIMAQTIVTQPESPIAFWGSIVPFTSPILMLIRIGFDVPLWELLLSGCLLVLTFIGTTWLASRIYRIGILMYGKKPSYKELYRWIRQSN